MLVPGRALYTHLVKYLAYFLQILILAFCLFTHLPSFLIMIVKRKRGGGSVDMVC